MASPITFAIGDIHGCYKELEALLAVCEKVDAAQDARFVFVGDYLDRGPDPKKVIDFLIDRQHRQPNRVVCLRGNHEQMLIEAADSGRSYRDLINWLVNGGEQTLDSYQVDDPREIPAGHLAFVATLPLKLVDRHRLYGIRPGAALSDQSPDDLLWIREHFCLVMTTAVRLWCTVIRQPSPAYPTSGPIGSISTQVRILAGR